MSNLTKIIQSKLTMIAFATLGVVVSGGCPAPPTPAAPTSGTVSFAQQVQPIFDAHCTTCHRVGGLADLEGIRLKLTQGVSFDLLVNQASTQRADLTLVVPGDSSASLLFLKVSSNSPPVGSTMPLVGARLSSADLGLIRDWIDQGAQNN